jgi:prepilin-type N-terminal cleavage/methylation domain-containing protein
MRVDRLDLARDTRLRGRQRAFTLVELLVVIAIIGILVALLLPAVQAAREAARRSQCVNNLKQIGIAIQNHELNKKYLPPGAIWDHFLRGKGSTLVHILPFIEQQAIYDLFDFKAFTIDGQLIPGTTTAIGATVIPTFVCPSDIHEPTAQVQGDDLAILEKALHNYCSSQGPTEHPDNPSGCSCSIDWNVLATAPYSFPDKFAGPFTRYGTIEKVNPVGAWRRKVKLKDITDGLTKTIFVGEVRPACSLHVARGWATTNNGCGFVSTLVPINFDSCNESTTIDGCRRPCNYNAELGFKSAHPGGANFSMGDASIQFISENIDMKTYSYLGDKADGQVAELSQ